MESEDICSFCLGGRTEIPPFGTIKDSQDLFHPCSTCSIMAHKKCLMEWFNSIPYESLKVVHARCIHDVAIRKARQGHNSNNEDNSGDNNDDAGNITDTEDLVAENAPARNSFLTFSLPEGLLGGMVSGVAEISIGIPGITSSNGFMELPESANLLSQQDLPFETNNVTPHDSDNYNNNDTHLTNVIAEFQDQNHDPEKCKNKTVALVFVPCPQCKQAIVFQMDRSQTIAFRESVKSVAVRLVQYGGVTLGIFSAITGIILTGYLGLTAVGINTMRSIVPSPILLLLFMRKPFKVVSRTPPPPSDGDDNIMGLILQGAQYLYRMANGINQLPLLLLLLLTVSHTFNAITDNIDNLQDAVIEGTVDPSSFNRIPALPIIMYRMRGSSLLECLFSKGEWRDNLSRIGTELLISTYLSSWGSHKLGRLLSSRSTRSLASWLFWKNVFLRDPDYILGTLMPLRWIYDLWFRLAVNRFHFRLTLKTVPRDIYNKFKNAQTLELIALQMGRIEMDTYLGNGSNGIAYRLRLFYKYNVLRLKYWYYETLAILAKDYSATMSSQSLIVKSIITMAWPFVSSYIGRLTYLVLTTKFHEELMGVPRANLLLLSNIIGLCLVVGIKDLTNLYQAYKVSNQINDVQIVTWNKTTPNSSTSPKRGGAVNSAVTEAHGLPGLFPRC
ncbi:uncharacterized protein KQ657_000598 [Scheffersomyces spartinae]|uniref:Uncharacterized protein n=1 Tax=Scheffersomyces spartinae TaxID=45513 RepID=A0A9P8AID0_9ASCO|nr:uncharacterized protein KQ657_000598 [Scheffersomyces spartinae]KAG7193529.1 hypothetical protein KQ657_000598 [Scheffersomyces spartinae]